MSKLKFSLGNFIKEDDLMKYSEKVSQIHQSIEQQTGVGNEFLGWKDLPENYDHNEVDRIIKKSKFLIDNGIEVLVVIGIGGSYLGVKAGLEYTLGLYPNKNEKKMEIIFAGTSFSSIDLAQKLRYVENKKFAINVISKSGTTTEPAIAFRMFKALLEEKIGKGNAKNFIISTTDANKGVLFELSKKNNYEMFVIPDDIGGRFSILTPVGLFPFSCAGINIKKILKGAKKGQELYGQNSLMDNDAYKYAVARHHLNKEKKYPIEMLVAYEPNLATFLEWWKQLFGESEGKKEKGIIPHSAVFSTDLHSLGQIIQDGSKVLFETIITIKKPLIDLQIIEDEKDEDKLNYLINYSVHEINDVAFKATLDAHSNIAKIPCSHIEISELDESSFGELIYFFEKAVTMSAYLLGVNPFDQPGVEIYKKNMFKLLKKPI